MFPVLDLALCRPALEFRFSSMRHYLCVAVLVCSSAGGKGHGKALAEAASAAPAETGGKVNHVSCSSGLTGDFVYETCASFCKEEAAETHCKFCKCKSCTFCGGTTHPKAKSPHSHLTAKKSKASSPKDEGHTSQLRSMAKDEGQSSAPHKSKTKKARPTSSASAGEPTASTAAAAALAVPTAATAAEPVPSSSGWTAAAAVVTLAAVVALYMSSRSSGREHEQVQTRDAELEASAPTRGLFDESALKPAAAGELGGLWSAEARVRTLCVALLCMQYAAYALLRRYSTGILKVRAEGIQGAAPHAMAHMARTLGRHAALLAYNGASVPLGQRPTHVRLMARHPGNDEHFLCMYFVRDPMSFDR